MTTTPPPMPSNLGMPKVPENKALWQRVCRTDPAHVKPITGKQYQGNSPKPYWIVERLTEEFGPCGLGWGFTILNERMERLSDTDILHVAVVRLWYVMPQANVAGHLRDAGPLRGELEQIGQTKATYMTSKGSLMVDEDAPKKSVTDALVKCASYLGFAGDIFSGRWDDSKYVAELKREFAEQKAAEQPNSLENQLKASLKAVSGVKPTADAGLGMDDEHKSRLDDIALHLIDCHKAGKDMDAVRIWYAADTFTDNDERVYVWSRMATESKLRATIKANRPAEAAA